MLAMIIVTTRFHDAVESVKVLAYGREGDQLPDQIRYRLPFGPPSPAQPKHDAAQARSGPARHGPKDLVLVLGGTMG
jgi:hypothetical protein